MAARLPHVATPLLTVTSLLCLGIPAQICPAILSPMYLPPWHTSGSFVNSKQVGLCLRRGTVRTYPLARRSPVAAPVLEDFVFHDLRRTAATRLGDLGANAYQIAAILGHGDIETSQLYAQATDDTLRRLMDELAEPKTVPAKVPPQEERRPLLTAVNS